MQKNYYQLFKILLLTFLSVVTLGTYAADDEALAKQNLQGIGEVYQIGTMNGPIYIGGQPAEDSFIQLKKLKIKTVINLGLPQDKKFDEAAAVKKLGFSYYNVPVNAKHVDITMLKQFNAAIYPGDRYPIFVHCREGQLSAMMLALNAISEAQMPVNMALDDAKKYGLTNPNLIQSVRQIAVRYHLPRE